MAREREVTFGSPAGRAAKGIGGFKERLIDLLHTDTLESHGSKDIQVGSR